MDVPLHKYWGTCPPCPIGIDAPDKLDQLTERLTNLPTNVG